MLWVACGSGLHLHQHPGPHLEFGNQLRHPAAPRQHQPPRREAAAAGVHPHNPLLSAAAAAGFAAAAAVAPLERLCAGRQHLPAQHLRAAQQLCPLLLRQPQVHLYALFRHQQASLRLIQGLEAGGQAVAWEPLRHLAAVEHLVLQAVLLGCREEAEA